MACTTPTIAATITRALGDTYSKVYFAVVGDDGVLLTSGQIAAFTTLTANVWLASESKDEAAVWTLAYESFTAPDGSAYNLSYKPLTTDLTEAATYYADIVLTTAGGEDKPAPTVGKVRIVVGA